YARALCGRLEEGRSWLEEALNVPTSMRNLGLGLFRAWRGEVLALQGHLEEAEEEAQDACDQARERGCRGHQAYALRLLAELAVRRTVDSSASTRYREALALAEELGMRPLVAHCYLGLGRLYGQTGQGEQARVVLSAAIDLYRAMDMPLWLPQAEAALVQVA